VFDNVAYGLRLRRSPRARIRAEVGRILERFGIAALADRQAHTLSGGEAQRASLARAVVVRPDLLLLDEPLGSLDAVTRERLQAELAQIVRALGLACVHVTHDQAEARRLGDRIALLDEGRLLQTGPPDELFYRPRSLRVARSLGTQNLWPGRVLAARPGGRSVVAVAGDRTLLGADPVGRADRSVVACLRAEDVRLRPAAEGAAAERAGEDGADGVNALEGVVVERVPIGPTYAVTVDCGLPVVALLARRAAADLGAEVGRRLAVSFAPAAVQLVDAER
jgi:ABC-type Fe3+/spermidine/putrescine transport system ATPase subunit